MQKEIKIYTTRDGKTPFSDWVFSLKNRIAAAAIKARIDRLATGNYGKYKALGNGIYELKINLAQATAFIMLNSEQ